MNDEDKFQELKKHFWWMVPLLLIGAVLLITGFDPLGNALGPQAERIAQIVITSVVIGYIIYLSVRKK